MRGKAFDRLMIKGNSRDHPRLCGEKTPRAAETHAAGGSPPPMRGKGIWNFNDQTVCGITPAYAGKRFKSFVDGLRIEDHPRLCGEKFSFSIQKNGGKGSPPPMRGKATTTRHSQMGSGITPAYAGKSSHLFSFNVSARDHPRLCGEKATANGLLYRNTRITPAYAGKRRI